MNIKVISLKRRPDRRLKFFKNFHKYFIFEFVDAMDGLEYTLTEEDKKMIKGNIYDTMDIHIPSLVCANRMHMKLYEECIRLNEPIIIFEDDAELIKPIDFSLEEIYNRTDLDVFWLMPDMVSILTYIVWPSGAKILLDYIKEVGLSDGLDIKYTGIKYSGRLREGKLHDEYFTQYPGVESDITPLPYYGNTKEEFDGFLRWQKDPNNQKGDSSWTV